MLPSKYRRRSQGDSDILKIYGRTYFNRIRLWIRQKQLKKLEK